MTSTRRARPVSISSTRAKFLVTGFLSFCIWMSALGDARGADVFWVGDQSGCSVNYSKASWFDGIFWLGFLPPGPGDVARLQTSNDPQNNQTLPHYIHFGAFTKCHGGICPNDAPFVGGDTSVSSLYVNGGPTWTLDFASGSTPGCSPPSALTGSLTVVNDLRIQTASLTIRNGTLATNYAAVSGPAATPASLSIQSGNLIGSTGSYLDIGIVGGVGSVSADAGSTISVGFVRIGENTNSQGTLILNGAGSHLTNPPGMQIGASSEGRFELHGGATADSGIVVFGNFGPCSGSSLGLVDTGSTWNTGSMYIADSSSCTATMRVLSGGHVNSASGAIGVNGSAAGVVEVDGAGSHWNVMQDIRVGPADAGSGLLTISNGGLVSAANILVYPNGTLRGEGSLSGNTVFSGSLEPGLPVGDLSVSGNMIHAGTGRLHLEIGGAGPGTPYDRVLVSGNATLGGNLDVVFRAGYLPTGGESFTVISAGTVTGTFASSTLPSLTGGLRWQVDYGTTAVNLRVVLPGDTNCDNHLDHSDVASFVLALTDPVGFAAAHPGCPILNADIDNNNAVNGRDVQAFVNLLLDP